MVAEGIRDPRGGSWGPDDTIIYSDGSSLLRRVSSAGGTIATLTTPDTSEASHRWPQFLPDGRHFLFSVRSGLSGKRGIYAGSLDGNTRRSFLFLMSISNGLYAPPGYLLYVDGARCLDRLLTRTVWNSAARTFTVRQVVGEATQGLGAFSVSQNGSAGSRKNYVTSGSFAMVRPAWQTLDSVGPVGDYPDFRLSPDDKQLAAITR